MLLIFCTLSEARRLAAGVGGKAEGLAVVPGGRVELSVASPLRSGASPNWEAELLGATSKSRIWEASSCSVEGLLAHMWWFSSTGWQTIGQINPRSNYWVPTVCRVNTLNGAFPLGETVNKWFKRFRHKTQHQTPQWGRMSENITREASEKDAILSPVNFKISLQQRPAKMILKCCEPLFLHGDEC